MIINLIRTLSIVIAFLAALVSSVLYVQLYLQPRSGRMNLIGILNIVIGLTMAGVIITSVIPTAHHTISIAEVVGTLFVGVFIIGQALYLFSTRSPLRLRRNLLHSKKYKKPAVSLPQDSPLTEFIFDGIDKQLRECLETSNSITTIQIFDMSRRLNLTDLYVPIRVLPEQSLEEYSTKILEIMPDEKVKETPEELISLERDKLSDLAKYAKEPIEIIARNSWRHCVLVGEAGIGKTTFLHFLALQVATRKIPSLRDITPIYIELNNFLANPEEDLLNFIIFDYEKMYGFSHEDSYKFFSKRCTQGKILLLLDALDETYGGETSAQAKDNYDMVCKAIEKIASVHPETRILVAVRKAIYSLKKPLRDAGGTPFKTLEMLGFFDEEQKQSLVTALLSRYQPPRDGLRLQTTPDLLMVALRQNQYLNELSQSPLLLMLLTLSYIRGWKDISGKRAEIYREFENVFLKRWDQSRGLFQAKNEIHGTERYSQFSPYEKHELLKQLAWEFHNERLRVFKEETVMKETVKLLDEKKSFYRGKKQEKLALEIIEEIITGSGLLRRTTRPTTRPTYCFSHHIFQEYFVAQFAAEAKEQTTRYNKELLEHQGDSWWEEVILLYAAYTNPDTIVNTLLLSGREDIFYTNFLLSGRYIASTTQDTYSNSPNIQQIIDKLFNLLCNTNTPSHSLGKQIAMTLAEIGQRNIDEQLIAVVKNKEQLYPIEVREMVVEALGKWGDKAVLEQLTDFLLQEPETPGVDMQTQLAIVKTLSQRRSIALALKIIPLLSQQIDSDLRQRIATMLGSLGRSYVKDEHSEVPDRLIEILKGPALHRVNDISIRQKIIQSLERLGDPLIIPELLELLSARSILPDEQTQIVHVLRELVPLSDNQQVQNDALDLFAHKLQPAPKDETLAQAYTLALGNWLKSITLIERVLPKIREIQQTTTPETNPRLLNRCKVLIPLFDKQASISDIDTLFTDKTVLDRELIKFLEGLNLLLLEDDINATQFFKKLAEKVFEPNHNSDLRKASIELLSKVANHQIAQDLISDLINKSKPVDDQSKRIDNKIFSTFIVAMQELYNRGKLNTRDVENQLPTLLVELSRQDADGDLLVGVAKTLVMIAPHKLKETIKILQTREDSNNAHKREEDDNAAKTREFLKLDVTDANIYYVLVLGILGEETMLAKLLPLLYKPYFDRKIRRVITDVIDRLSSRSDKQNNKQWNIIAQELEQKLADMSLINEIQESIVDALKYIARNVDDEYMSKRICETLVKYIDTPGISETVYKAVEQISMQKDLRVYRHTEDNGEIRVKVGFWKDFPIFATA